MSSIGASGSKSKSKESGTINQTQTNTLSNRAAGMLQDGINDAKGMNYRAFDPASISQYANPYTEDVINATLAQSDQTDAIARNQQQSDIAGASAFGDKRRGVYEAELAGNQSRDRASLIAGMRDNNYGQARAIAQGENQNSNQYDLMLQQLMAQLRGGFTNEGTQVVNGKTTGKTSGYKLGFTGGYGG